MTIVEAIHLADAFLFETKGLVGHPESAWRHVRFDRPTVWRISYGIRLVRTGDFRPDELDRDGCFVVCVDAQRGEVTV